MAVALVDDFRGKEHATLKALPCDGHRIAGTCAPFAIRGSMDLKRIRIKRDVADGAEKPAVVEPIDPFERASRFAPMQDVGLCMRTSHGARIQPHARRSFNVALWYARVARWT